MIKYDDIKLSAFCGVETFKKLSEKLPIERNYYAKTLKYQILSIFASEYCEEGFVSILKNEEYEKFDQYIDEQEAAAEKLKKFHETIDSFKF